MYNVLSLKKKTHQDNVIKWISLSEKQFREGSEKGLDNVVCFSPLEFNLCWIKISIKLLEREILALGKIYYLYGRF